MLVMGVVLVAVIVLFYFGYYLTKTLMTPASSPPSEGAPLTAPAQEGSGAPSGSSVQAPKQQYSMPTEASVSKASVAATYGGIPVRAVDKAADAGISENTETYGAIIADFNNDTEPDIFLGRHSGQPRLYENSGNGHFEETNQGMFAPTDRHGCDAADVNGDGLKDIFCTEGAAHGTSTKRNELYIQRPDHTFADQAGEYGVLDPFGRGRSGRFFDANGDSRPDLFLANNPTRGDGLPSPNRFFINQLGNAFHSAPEYGLELETSLQGSNNVSVGDLDQDGWQDLLMITPEGLRVYHNEQGKGFTEVAATVGLGQSPQDLTLADVNGDSWLDVIEVEPNKLSVFVNTSRKFSNVMSSYSSVFSTTLQYGDSVAAGDVNGDNRPDIYVMRGSDTAGNNAPDQVYTNDGDGANFTRMSSIPSTSQGEANFVAPIDYDGNGLTDFLVLNGGGEKESGPAGPVELIAFFSNTTPTDPEDDVTITFSEDMMAKTVNDTTFKLFKQGSTTKIPATVSYDASTYTATLDPTNNLQSGVTYKAVVTTGAKDLEGNSLEWHKWSFVVR
jgi:hypothetical protein